MSCKNCGSARRKILDEAEFALLHDKATEEAARFEQRLRWKLQNVSEGIAGDYAVHEQVFIAMAEEGLLQNEKPQSPPLTPEEKLKLIDKARRQDKE
jgi:hypothetical protein